MQLVAGTTLSIKPLAFPATVAYANRAKAAVAGGQTLRAASYGVAAISPLFWCHFRRGRMVTWRFFMKVVSGKDYSGTRWFWHTLHDDGSYTESSAGFDTRFACEIDASKTGYIVGSVPIEQRRIA